MAQIPPDAPPGTPSSFTPPAAPAAPPAAPAAPPPPAEPPAALVEPPAPETLTMTSEQLKERLERAQATARATFLKENGYESEEAFVAAKKAADEAAAALTEAERKEMSELEKYKADLAAEQAKTTEAEAKAAASEQAAVAARRESHLRSLFAQRGIVNADYAFHLVNKACGELAEGAQLNEESFLDGLIADEAQKAALGVPSAPPAEGLATTTPPVVQTPPPPGAPPTTDALAMDRAAWEAHKKKHGIR